MAPNTVDSSASMLHDSGPHWLVPISQLSSQFSLKRYSSCPYGSRAALPKGMYRPSNNRWQHRQKQCFPTTFQMLSQLGNISRVSSGMTSKSVACVLVSHSKWKTPLSLYRSNKCCTNTSGRFQVHLRNRMTNKR
jgi:hypothetical protein